MKITILHGTSETQLGPIDHYEGQGLQLHDWLRQVEMGGDAYSQRLKIWGVVWNFVNNTHSLPLRHAPYVIPHFSHMNDADIHFNYIFVVKSDVNGTTLVVRVDP